MTPPPPSVVAALATMTAADATRPLITYYDDATGERLDLSGATLGNWVAKTANLLVDGHGLGPGDVAAVVLPPHWLTAAVLLGCWSAGLAIGSGADDPAAVGFARSASEVAADEVYALSLAPLGAPFRPVPPTGTLDYVVEVRPFGDQFTPRVTGADVALADGTTHAALVASARPVPGPRVLIDATRTADPVDWLVAPLVAGARLVLCANLDPARVDDRLATERAVLWPDPE
jgi:uncharacterized protein (TIGR03089 family)